MFLHTEESTIRFVPSDCTQGWKGGLGEEYWSLSKQAQICPFWELSQLVSFFGWATSSRLWLGKLKNCFPASQIVATSHMKVNKRARSTQRAEVPHLCSASFCRLRKSHSEFPFFDILPGNAEGLPERKTAS